MGGQIAVTIRLSEEEIYKIEFYTNGLENFKTLDFYNKSSEFLHEKRLKSWTNELKSVCAPSEYGLIVFDFVTKTMITNNHYTGMTNQMFVSTFLWNDCCELKKLYDAGMLTKICIGYHIKRTILPSLSLKEFGETFDEILLNIKTRYEAAKKHNYSISDKTFSKRLKARNSGEPYIETDPALIHDSFSDGAFIIDVPFKVLFEGHNNNVIHEWKEIKRIIQEDMKIPLDEADETVWTEFFEFIEEI